MYVALSNRDAAESGVESVPAGAGARAGEAPQAPRTTASTAAAATTTAAPNADAAASGKEGRRSLVTQLRADCLRLASSWFYRDGADGESSGGGNGRCARHGEGCEARLLRPPAADPRYLVVGDAPVCLWQRDRRRHGSGQLLVGLGNGGGGEARLAAVRHATGLDRSGEVAALTEAALEGLLRSANASSAAEALPAVLTPAAAVLGWGSFVGNHLMHVLTDVLAPALAAVDDADAETPNGTAGALQAVMLDGHTEMWTRPHGSHRLAREAFNILSRGPRAGGGEGLPPLDTAAYYTFRDDAAGAPYLRDVGTDSPRCFCGAIVAPADRSWRRGGAGSSDTVARGLRRAAELAPRQFRDVHWREANRRRRRRGEAGAPEAEQAGTNKTSDAAEEGDSRWPPLASAYWKESGVQRPGDAAAAASYRPKLLFLKRRGSRRQANEAAVIAAARATGAFRVEEAFPEQLSPAAQYYLAATADVLLGMHGLALTHLVWMAGGLRRQDARCAAHVVEFLHWVPHDLVTDYARLSEALGIGYTAVPAEDVRFLPGVRAPLSERRALRESGAVERMQAYARPSWWAQEVTHNVANVTRILGKLLEGLQACDE